MMPMARTTTGKRALRLTPLKKIPPPPPPVGSVVEVNVTADMGAGASQIGIHVFTITECGDDGAMMSRNQDGQVMNIFLEDYEWKQKVRKCGECFQTSGGKKVPVNIVVCCYGGKQFPK
jgi:hypothetical protein